MNYYFGPQRPAGPFQDHFAADYFVFVPLAGVSGALLTPTSQRVLEKLHKGFHSLAICTLEPGVCALTQHPHSCSSVVGAQVGSTESS